MEPPRTPPLTRALAVLWLACQPAPGPAAEAGAPPGPGTCPSYATVAEVEANIVVPKCGRPGDPICHSAGPYTPKIAAAGSIAINLLDVTPRLNCKGDKLVDREDPGRSFMLAKIRAPGELAVCSDGGNGGPRMPYADAPPLTADERSCLVWWVYRIAE